MLMLGMMLGVLTLSASADADNLPVLVNHPTLIYHKTPKVHPDDNDTTWIDDEYYHYSSFNVVMDDSECNDGYVYLEDFNGERIF